MCPQIRRGGAPVRGVWSALHARRATASHGRYSLASALFLCWLAGVHAHTYIRTHVHTRVLWIQVIRATLKSNKNKNRSDVQIANATTAHGAPIWAVFGVRACALTAVRRWWVLRLAGQGTLHKRISRPLKASPAFPLRRLSVSRAGPP